MTYRHLLFMQQRLMAQLRLGYKDKFSLYVDKKRHVIDCTALCMSCNRLEQETLGHFILLCPIYKPYRLHYLQRFIPESCTIPAERVDSTMLDLLNCSDDLDKVAAICRYVRSALRLRSFSLNE
uniref:Uncharacterized protein n=1 Tax=Lygus hesperus TaxID=30085 RepID=A0A146M3I0_LYGHE